MCTCCSGSEDVINGMLKSHVFLFSSEDVCSPLEKGFRSKYLCFTFE